MSHLMEKIKLSTYVKKGIRNNNNSYNGFESTGNNFYDNEQPMMTEAKTK
jgi:hypothetical protein